MNKIFIVFFLFILFNYVDLQCHEASKDDKTNKDECLSKKPDSLDTAIKYGDFNPDTCCYSETKIKCDGKSETQKSCSAYDKKNLNKMIEEIKKLSNAIKIGNCEYEDPDINCSSYYLNLGFLLLLIYLF